MSGEERSGEEDGPLYKMDALTSKANALTSSPFKPSGNSASSEEDVNETPIARKIAERKGKAKEVARVVGKGEGSGKGGGERRARCEGKDSRSKGEAEQKDKGNSASRDNQGLTRSCGQWQCSF